MSCSGFTPLRLSRGFASNPRTPGAPTRRAVFFIVLFRGPSPVFFCCLGCGLRPFFFRAGRLAVWLCFVVLCVHCSSVCWSGFLCFPNGSVLVSGIGWSGCRFVLFPFVDKIGQFVDFSCVFADIFVTLQYNKRVKLWLKSWFLMSHVSRVAFQSACTVVSVALMFVMLAVVSGLIPVACRLFLPSCVLCVLACILIALFSMCVFIPRRGISFVKSAGTIARSARPHV